MNLYLAAIFTNSYFKGQRHYPQLNEHEQKILDHTSTRFLLESYAYVEKQSYVNAMRENGAKIFLDSGAFTAFTLGKKIDIQAYCNYVKQNIDIIRNEDGILMVSVLDDIADPLGTWRNVKTMEALGVKPLPCFHQGEDEKYLEYYIQNYEYITIGGLVGTSAKALTTWLDRLWGKYFVDGSGRPKLKVHGFGITSTMLVDRYPWHSLDSSSWVQGASFGFIITPDHRNITVSNKSKLRQMSGAHATTLTEVEREYVLQMLESQGFTLERLAEKYVSRAAYNIWSFGIIEAMKNATHDFDRFNYTVQELF